MMIVSEYGLMQMLSLSDSLRAQEFKQFVQEQHSQLVSQPNAVYAEASAVE